MLVSIGGTEFWTCTVTYRSLGATQSFQSLGADESYWSLMEGTMAPNPDYSYEDLGVSESFQSIGTSESYWSLIPRDATAWTTDLLEGSFSLDDRIEERSVCSFQIRDDDAENHFRKGQKVIVKNFSGERIFGGYIDEVEETQIPGNTALLHSIDCVDNHYLADKRIVAYSAEDKSAGTIVAEIITDCLAVEGITAGTIQDGPTIAECILSYITAADALDEMAEQAGFVWWIDPWKRLYFVERSYNTAPWALTAVDALDESIAVIHGNSEYRNRQYIIGGLASTDEQTETFKGDGETRTFALAYPVKSITSIKVNDVEKTVGVRGDSGNDWYYAEQQSNVNQDSAGVKLESTDTLEVKYIGFYDVIGVSEDNSAVNDRQSVESDTSGYVEVVNAMPNVQSTAAAEDAAEAKLSKYATIGKTLTFTTRRSGLEAGQLLTATLTEHDITAEELLITSVETREEDRYIWYDVEATAGPVGLSWSQFFARLASGAKVETIKKSASGANLLIRMLNFSKTWPSGESPNIFSEVYPGDATFPDGSLLPAFDVDDDRVKYCSLWTAAGEIFRKAITSSSGMTSSTITTITMINASEATDEDITHIGWFGGVAATVSLGTGILIDKQAYARSKTALESWQVTKVDARGW